ncbi:MAG: Cohesin domain protein [Candidatus Accumulibacter sp. SK-11]|nr:MAG: Cohesin domain protein [Candidatus Accumulibacter sp. SK-11]HRL77935.1 cohesin domain-containing protein [Candidatus Accumulibacter phosphatis]
MNPRIILASLAAAAAVGLSAHAAAGYVLSLHATPPSGMVGGQVVVDVHLTLDGGDTLLGMDFVLNYDPAVLTYRSIDHGSLTTPKWDGFLPEDGWYSDAWNDSSSGQVTATFLDLTLTGLDSASGTVAGSIASLTFAPSAVGISDLTLSGIVLANTQGDQQPPSATPGSARVEVQPGGSIPSPASPPLVGLALALLYGLRRRGAGARRVG